MERRLEQIEGSRYFRWFCDDCGKAIRIRQHETNFRCEECSGAKAALMPDPRPATVDADSGGYQQIAIRFLENDRTEL